MLSFNQKTIDKPITLTGVGLHNGVIADLVIKPASENFGINFCRVDIDKDDLIIANFKNVIEPILCTKISNKNGVTVSTVEHLMAAFFGEGIDNALVEINASEIPILDGSASEFVEAIRSAGIKEQSAPRQFIQVEKKIEIREGEKFISIEPSQNDLIIDFEIVYKNPLIRTRRKEFRLSKGQLSEIYNSRTFCLYEDIDLIKSKGLAKGGSLENAIVVKDNEILNDDGLRNRHEFVYHKILDCIGDLMLSGNRIIGHVITSQGGHALTNKLLLKFFADKSNWSLKSGKTINKKAQINETLKKSLVVGA
tara:strand:+ start:405 stop:1331 length:927 start_codon:yes stop_codon:yes gene_type:complete